MKRLFTKWLRSDSYAEYCKNMAYMYNFSLINN